MENNNTPIFSYTYSAKEQEEIKAIRKKYETPNGVEDKMSRLRQLDARVTQKAQAVSLICGVLGALILGFGMSLILTGLSATFGISQTASTILGGIIGVLGLFPIMAAYPVYNRTLQKEREKVTPEILRLTDELMK